VARSQPTRPVLCLPELVAHRGWAARCPENTLSALGAAVGTGASWVEVDVQLSSDAHPVLFHDRGLERMCGVAGAVHEKTLADLRALSCAERGRFGERFVSERIAELAMLVQLLSENPDVFAFVEIKRISIERFGAGTVLDRVIPVLEPAGEQVALISFSLACLAEARARTSLPIGAVFDAWPKIDSAEARALDPEFVFVDVEGLPATGPLRSGKARVAVYEVADPQLAVDLAARGVDLVETFAIGEMLSGLREIEARGR
jgi:glycerophosphoryl diester phosphodiesterase